MGVSMQFLPAHAAERKMPLTLGELRLLTCFTQTDFLTLNFTRVTGNETGFTQRTTQAFIVFHQRTSQTVTDCARLTEATTTTYSDFNVEQFL